MKSNIISSQRHGISLIELIVVLAILALLLAILLPAVSTVRQSAALVQNKNNLRQIILATHEVAAEQEGKIEGLMKSNMQGIQTIPRDAALFYRLVPYLNGVLTAPTELDQDSWEDYLSPKVKVYHNPSDPSWNYNQTYSTYPGKCSYGLNILAMNGSLSFDASLPDGSSQTISFVDKYAVKGSSDPKILMTTSANIYTEVWDPLPDMRFYGARRATFADRGWGDVLPVTNPATLTTMPSIPGLTFQVQPKPEEVDSRIPQTPHLEGLTAAMFDGSVRTISLSVSETVFWAMVTPAGGESVQ